MPARQPPPSGQPPTAGPDSGAGTAAATAAAAASPAASTAVFDVYIVGGERLDQPALLNVAGLIASRYRLAAPSVAEGLSGEWCLVAKSVVEPAAKRLAEELGDLGARARLLPAGATLPTSRPTPPSPTRDARRAPTPASPQEGQSMIARAAWPRFVDDVLNNPLRRAFAGLALALVIGFLPAAYYSFGISGAEVRQIRARQRELSGQPGTKPVIDEFDRLEGAIAQVRHRGLVHTAILWVMVTGIAGAGLSRLAARGERASDPLNSSRR